MSIFLTHSTAREFYRYCNEPGSTSMVMPDVKSACTPPEVRSYGFDIDDVEEGIRGPFEVFVSSGSARRRSASVKCHVVPSSLGPGHFRSFGSGIYVVSPALCLVQFACSASLLETVLFSCELCGTYYRKSPEISELFSREPLTSREALLAEMKELSGVCGVKRCLQALQWTIDGCASPMEVRLCLRFCLPYRLGGYNLPLPQANYRLTLSPDEQRAIDRAYCIGDMVWPEYSIVVEYDSFQYHTGRSKMEEDSTRRSALRHAGYDVVEVTYKQLSSIVEFEQVVDFVAAKMGKRMRPQYLGATPQRQNLMRELFRLAAG